MGRNDLTTGQSDALFGVRRSVMYHARRVGFFETLQRVTAILTISVAGFIFFEVSGVTLPTWMAWLACVAGLFSIFDLVVSYSQRADQHRHLRREFCELEVDMSLTKADDAEKWQQLEARRLRIEINEPPIYRALDLLCHNALMIADGISVANPEHKKHFRKISRRYRFTAQLLRWENIGTDPDIIHR